jgi:hypothetical protein
MVGEVVPFPAAATGCAAGGRGTPSPVVTPQRAVGGAGAGASGISSGCGAICRAGGVNLIATVTNPDAPEATLGVVDAALRLLEALMMVGYGLDDAYDTHAGVGASYAAAAAADAADAADARRVACSSEMLRANLARLLAGGGAGEGGAGGAGGGNNWAEEAEEVRDGATLALAQLAGEAEEGSGAVATALAALPAAVERLIAVSCTRGSGQEEEEEDDEEEGRSEMRQAALYLLGAVCAVLEGRVAAVHPPLSAHQRTEALARLTAAVLRGAEREGIGTWGGEAGPGGSGDSAHHAAAVNAVIQAVCRAAVAWEQTVGAGPFLATTTSEAGAAVRAFTAHLKLSG